MAVNPYEYSNLCFLPPAEQQQLEKLVRTMNAAKKDYDLQCSNGDMAVKAMTVGKLKLPTRNAMESGSKHDQNIQNWARMSLENVEEKLQQKWENCTAMTGYLAISIAHQQEAAALLDSADRAEPAENSKSWQVAVNRSEEVHDLLNDLETELQNFRKAPLVARFDLYDTRLGNIVEPIEKMKKEHAHFLRNLGELSVQDIYDETNEYVEKAGTYLKKLDEFSEALGKVSQLVPDLRDITCVYQPAISSARKLR